MDTTKNDTHDNNKKMLQFLNKKYIILRHIRKMTKLSEHQFGSL